MKSNTLWIVLGIIVLLAVIWGIHLYTKLQNAKYPPPGTGSICSRDTYICGISLGGTIRCCPMKIATERTLGSCPVGFHRDYVTGECVLNDSLTRDVHPVAVLACPDGQFKCSMSSSGEWGPDKNGSVCCANSARGIQPVNDLSGKTTQKEFCERHGGTWTGTQCTYYAEPTEKVAGKHTITTVVNPRSQGTNGATKG